MFSLFLPVMPDRPQGPSVGVAETSHRGSPAFLFCWGPFLQPCQTNKGRISFPSILTTTTTPRRNKTNRNIIQKHHQLIGSLPSPWLARVCAWLSSTQSRCCCGCTNLSKNCMSSCRTEPRIRNPPHGSKFCNLFIASYLELPCVITVVSSTESFLLAATVLSTL